MHKLLKGKRILVTAGPTWVSIDRVRVISNVSSGFTGIIIANHAAKLGADVTLLLGPVSVDYRPKTKDHRPKILRFKYFDELQKLITDELRRKKYDIIIHGAAVSDYKPVRIFAGKIKSGKNRFTIYLKPTLKIIDKIRRFSKGAFLVMFKLETKKSKKELVDLAYKAMLRSRADLIVANNIDEVGEKRHRAYIVSCDKKVIQVDTKEKLAKMLLREIAMIWKLKTSR